jgi:hypothetical protein
MVTFGLDRGSQCSSRNVTAIGSRSGCCRATGAAQSAVDNFQNLTPAYRRGKSKADFLASAKLKRHCIQRSSRWPTKADRM